MELFGAVKVFYDALVSILEGFEEIPRRLCSFFNEKNQQCEIVCKQVKTLQNAHLALGDLVLFF